MSISKEKAFFKQPLCAARFSSPPAFLAPNFLHGAQADTAAFSQYCADYLDARGETGITMEPKWTRWDDRSLYEHSDTTFWDACRDTAEVLRQRGGFSWVYDEPGFPSGSAGLKAMLYDPACIQLGLECAEVLPGQQPPDGYLALFALTFDGDCPLSFAAVQHPGEANGRRVFALRVVEIIEGGFTHIHRHAKQIPDDLACDRRLAFGYPNLLEEEGTEAFIQTAYEPYARELDGYLGSVVTAFFTDEPVIPFRHYVRGGELPPAVPWRRGMRELYRDAYGEDILPVLPCLFYDLPGSGAVRVRFYRLVADLFARNFMQKLSDWCASHDMYLTGHFLHEEPLATQALCSGSILHAAKFMSMPGTDNLSMGFPGRGVGLRPSVVGSASQNGAVTPKMISSAAHLAGWERTASESHGWAGPQAGTSFAGYIGTANWQAVLGINTLPYYCMDWLDATDAQRRQYNAHASRLSYMTTIGQHVARTAVLHPMTHVWAHITPLAEDLPDLAGFSPDKREFWYYCADAHINEIQSIFDDVAEGLLSRQCDFDYVEDEDIASAVVGDGEIRIGSETFSVLVLPAPDYLSPACLDAVIRFADAGGHVVVAGHAPAHLADGSAAPWPEHHMRIRAYSRPEEACAAAAEEGRTVRLEQPAPYVYVQRRKAGLSDIYFITNIHWHGQTHCVHFPSHGAPQLWDPFTGKRYVLPYTPEADGCMAELRLDGYCGYFVVFGAPGDALPAAPDMWKPCVQAPDAAAHAAALEQLTRERYTDVQPGAAIETPPLALWSPRGGLTLDGGRLEVAPYYRPGDALEGAYCETRLSSGVWRVEVTAAPDNINSWAIIPRHYDADGKELIEKGINGYWRNELPIVIPHGEQAFALWFRVPEGTVRTRMMVCPMCKRLFSEKAALDIRSFRLQPAAQQ